jgi:cell division protein FtsW
MLRQSSIILCVAVAALVALGLVMQASTSAWVHGLENPYFFLRKQSQMVVLGLLAGIAAAFVSPELMRRTVFWQMLVVCVLLALCFVPGIGIERYGSKRWINLVVIEFQPSELAKIVTIVALAAWFARWQTEVKTFWRGFVLPGTIAVVPVLLIAAESDAGTALTLSAAIGAVLFCVGTRLTYLVPTTLAGIGGAAFLIFNDPVRKTRILAWLDLDNPIYKDINQQQVRSLYALGNGGPEGVGLGNGLEKFGNLPFAHIDFIFPVIGEELGLPFTLGVVLCYVLIALAGIGIALQANHVFSRCMALGLTCVIVVPAIVNIGVTTAVLPNDGLPLPFVSYGGTSLVFSLAAVGLLLGIHRRTRAVVAKEFPLTRETRLAIRL